MRKPLIPLALATAFAVAGCFNEPTPAYREAAPETRVYLKEKGLSVLSEEAVYRQGLVFVQTDSGKTDGANSKGSWTNLSARVCALKPASLDYLNLDRNALTNVSALTAFTGLRWLRLNGNRLESLPDLSALGKLERIYLSNNRFKTVPETLKKLPALTDVDLSGNPIEVVPDWLAAQEGLKNLSFTRTKLKALPADLSAWKSLVTLQLGELSLSIEEMKRIRAALPRTAVAF